MKKAPLLYLFLCVFYGIQGQELAILPDVPSKEQESIFDARTQFINKFAHLRQHQENTEPKVQRYQRKFLPYVVTMAQAGAMLCGSIGWGSVGHNCYTGSIGNPVLQWAATTGALVCAGAGYLMAQKLKSLSVMQEKPAYVFYLNISGELTATAWYIKQLHNAFKDPAIKAVILYVNSPGGHMATGEIIAQEIIRLKEEFQKPVIVFGEYACSGAYLIAAAADYIIASSQAPVGNVGVRALGFLNKTNYIKEKGMEYEIYRSVPYKGFPNDYEKTPEEIKERLQQGVNQSHEYFIQSLMQWRPWLASTQVTWNNGLIFYGQEALELGLIDQIGYPSDVTDILEEVLGTPKIVPLFPQ